MLQRGAGRNCAPLKTERARRTSPPDEPDQMGKAHGAAGEPDPVPLEEPDPVPDYEPLPEPEPETEPPTTETSVSDPASGKINYVEGAVDITFPAPPAEGTPINATYDPWEADPSEPSAVDRLAAIEDPTGEAAERIWEWKRKKTLFEGIVKVSNDIYEATKRISQLPDDLVSAEIKDIALGKILDLIPKKHWPSAINSQIEWDESVVGRILALIKRRRTDLPDALLFRP